MRISPQAILCFHQEVRRQLVSLDLAPRRKIVERLSKRSRISPPHERHLHLQPSPLLRQTAPAPVPQDENFSIELPSQPSFSSWKPLHQSTHVSPQAEQVRSSLGHLPVSCPGCGALTQEVDGDEAGFYMRSRKSVKEYIRLVKRAQSSIEHDANQASVERERSLEDESQQQVPDYEQQESEQEYPPAVVEPNVPFCDRCHNLLHQSKGVPIAHPTIDSIADTIQESPFRRNHVYHVLDAADFPLSLVPSIFDRLTLARPRSQNRRSQHDFSTKTTISFIITRSDLLAPQKEMVDTLMPYFITVLREALGRKGQDMRLGNVHLVSAKRGWWTKEIKEAIYNRGGGNWMVGKFNVGKSNLFEVLFPKGYTEQAPVYSLLQREQGYPQFPPPTTEPQSDSLFSETSLLPPPQPSTAYPTLPLVSPLPGTTASPIRLPFGSSRNNSKGELIDLPGLPRGKLSSFVTPEHQRSLLMEHRPTVTQHVLKAGQSLLLGGGLMRITPVITPTSNPHDETVILAYPFTPLPAHVTSTEKADLTQRQLRGSGIQTMLAPQAGESIKSAGIFALDTDVTKSRSGALLRAGVPLAKLPFRVKGTDILLEGVGWVELICQVRHRRKRWDGDGDQDRDRDQDQIQDQRRQPTAEPNQAEHRTRFSPSPNHAHEQAHHPTPPQDALSILDNPFFPPTPPPQTQPRFPSHQRTTPSRLEPRTPDFPTPTVEIFTPDGASVGQRRCLGAWMLIHGARRPGETKSKKSAARARPRKSMKGMKKRGKAVAAEG
jgi:genetic interactor of prohibitins 3, mitochondrial